MAGYLLLSDPSVSPRPPPLPLSTSCIYRKLSSGTNEEQTENNKYSDYTPANQTTAPRVPSVRPLMGKQSVACKEKKTTQRLPRI